MRAMRVAAPVAALLVTLIGSACGSSTSSTSSTAGGGAAVAGAGSSATASPSPPAAAGTARSTASNSLHLTVSGTVRGAALQGQTAAVPTCEDVMAGEIVTWSGAYGTGGRLAGELDLPSGSGTLQFGGGGSLAANLVVDGDDAHRLDGASGTVTVAGDHQSGSIDAQFRGGSDSLHVTGSWACP
ncbi:MAG TPA: hypothetical protein VFO60_05690 [Candidatus Dormibacteraeota bacterium]|nr:hypothetical protein [Candidatus Dormibacteraeota bacterium]